MTTDKRVENFEKYLEDVCFEANPSVLDDDMPNFFDDWLSQQEGEDYIRHTDNYRKDLMNDLVERLEVMKSKQKIDNGHDCYERNCDYCENMIADKALTEAQTIIKNITRE